MFEILSTKAIQKFQSQNVYIKTYMSRCHVQYPINVTNEYLAGRSKE